MGNVFEVNAPNWDDGIHLHHEHLKLIMKENTSLAYVLDCAVYLYFLSIS